MILPWLRGFPGFLAAPLTWTLIGINCLFFILCGMGGDDTISLNKKEMEWAGRFYAQMQGEEIPVDPVQQMIKGAQALRDPTFYDRLPDFKPTQGDDIAYAAWKKKVIEFDAALQERPVNTFGLHGGNNRPLAWITYQFMHAGLMHLVGNMLMLLIFGAALEHLVGSALLVFLYLVGGIAGAFLFLLLSPVTSAPMVGASGALSALMGFYALFEKKKRVRFLYFLSPATGFWGAIYLPTLLILPLYFVEDLASYLASSNVMGTGIAYAAHMGGAAFGMLVALALRQVCVRSPRWERILYASYSQSRNETP